MASGDDIPFLNMFIDNPLGTAVAILILFMLLSFWQSNLSINPFSGESGFITIWGTLSSNFNWFLTISIPFMFAAFAFSALRDFEPGESITERIGGSITRPGLRARSFLRKRPRKLVLNAGPGQTAGESV